MSRRLLLFTDTFPYGYGETFLADEYPFLEKRFGDISIFALYNKDISGKLMFPGISERERLCPQSSALLDFNPKDKPALLVHGIFNLSPVGFAIKELFRARAWKSVSRMRLLLTYTLITRAILSGRTYKSLRHMIRHLGQDHTGGDKAPLLYFYWGDRNILMLPFLRKALPSGTKTIARFHGSDLYEEAKGYLPFRKPVFKSIDIAYPISISGYEYLKNRYPGMLKEIRPRHLGSSGAVCWTGENFNTEKDTLHILTLSNIIPLKRLDLIAKAVCSIKREEAGNLRHIRWTHIGDGPKRKDLERLVSEISAQTGEAGLAEVEFKGKITHPEVLRFMQENDIDLFINASSSEGTPVSIMEAMSFGIPVIATDVGATREVMDGSGMLIGADTSAVEIKRCILTYAALGHAEKMALRARSRKVWEKSWNKDTVYPAFVTEISEL